MKQTVRLAGGINELFGTLDENLKLFESALHVTTHLRDHDLEIEGSEPQVERAAPLPRPPIECYYLMNPAPPP